MLELYNVVGTLEKILSNSIFLLDTLGGSSHPPFTFTSLQDNSVQGGFPRFFSSKSMEIVGSLIMKRTFLLKLPLLGVMLPGSNHMKVASPLVWAVAACVVDPSYQSRHGPGLGSWVHVHVQGSSKKEQHLALENFVPENGMILTNATVKSSATSIKSSKIWKKCFKLDSFNFLYSEPWYCDGWNPVPENKVKTWLYWETLAYQLVSLGFFRMFSQSTAVHHVRIGTTKTQPPFLRTPTSINTARLVRRGVCLGRWSRTFTKRHAKCLKNFPELYCLAYRRMNMSTYILYIYICMIHDTYKFKDSKKTAAIIVDVKLGPA